MQITSQQYRDQPYGERDQRPAFDAVAESVYRSSQSLILCRLITTLLEKGVLTPNEARYVACSSDYDWSV